MLFPCPPATPRRATSSPTHGFSRNTRPESRNTAFMLFTKHETRLFFESRPFCRVGRQVMREGGQAHGLRGVIYEARENEWKGVFLNPETGITTYTESGFGSRFGIPHYSSVFVGKIRISPCRPSSAPAHCGNRDIGFMDASHPRVSFPGPQVSPSGGVKGERATNRETRPFTRRAAQVSPGSEVFTKHETRDTKHGLFSKHGFDGRSGRHGSGRVASRKTAARSLLSCALWRGKRRLWRGMGGMERPEPLSAHHPHQQQGHSGFHETRDPRPETRITRHKSCIWVLKPFSHFFPSRAAWHEDSEAQSVRVTNQGFQGFTNHYPLFTAFMLFTKHETRNTNHGFFSKHGFYRRAVRRGCETFAQPTAATRTAAPVTQSLFSCSLLFAIVHYCSLLFTIVRYCSLKNISRSQCSITVRRFRSASRRAPFAAVPVSLRVAFAAAIAKWTHAEKRQCTGSHQRGKLSLLR